MKNKMMTLSLLFSLVFFMIFLACGICPAATPENNNTLAITDVTVIDVVQKKVLPAMTVIIQGDKIGKVGSSSSTRPPAGARIIQAQDKYLIPGLCDMHVHFAAEESNLLLFLVNGVTLIRDMGSVVIDPDGEDGFTYVDRRSMIGEILEARNRVEQGDLLGPTIITPGMILTGPLPPEAGYESIAFQWALANPEEARNGVRSLNDQDVDFIKVHTLPSREVYFAIAEEAKKQGLSFAGHVPISITAAEAVRAGQESIEHMTGVKEYIESATPKGDKDAMERRKHELFTLFVQSPDTWHVPTMVVNQAFLRAKELYSNPEKDPRLKYIRPELKAWWKEYWPPHTFAAGEPQGEATLADKMRWVDELDDMGVNFMAGTDFAVPFVYPGFSLHEELILLNRAGLTPMESLQAATLNPALFLEQAHLRGSIEEGKIADLVLLDANPQENIANSQTISGVILRGQYFSKKQLQEKLDLVAASVKTDAK